MTEKYRMTCHRNLLKSRQMCDNAAYSLDGIRFRSAVGRILLCPSLTRGDQGLLGCASKTRHAGGGNHRGYTGACY